MSVMTKDQLMLIAVGVGLLVLALADGIAEGAKVEEAKADPCNRRLRVRYEAYRDGKPVAGAQAVEFDVPLTWPVSYPSINAAMDRTRGLAAAAIRVKHAGAYPVLANYDTIETDEPQPCYCRTCRSKFVGRKVYGARREPDLRAVCPAGHLTTTSCCWGWCRQCSKGKTWETRREGTKSLTECDHCGAKAAEWFDDEAE